MKIDIPTAATIRAALEALSHAQMQELARTSELPFTTLWKIRAGETTNPRLETVRQLLLHLPRRALAGA